MLALTTPSRASEQSATNAAAVRSYALEYTADARCPAEAELVARVKQRSHRAQRVVGSAAVTVRIEVGSDPPRGTLRYAEAGVEAEREVEGADCDEVVSALALVLALLVDPDAEAPTPEPPSTATTSPRLQPATKPAASAPTAVRPTFGVRGGAARGVDQGFVPYLGVSGGVVFESTAPVLPAVRLDILLARGSAENSSGRAELEWLAARAGVCVVVAPDDVVSPRACATFELGRLSAQGTRVATPRSVAVTWYGPGAQLGLGVRPVDPLTLSAEVGAVAPLVRDSFFFRPDDEVHQIPAVAPYLGLAAETRF